MHADWDHLKVVLAIDRGKSLTVAANLLGMDQTTAGRRLSALEARLGTPLFLRAKSGFSATEAGQIVVQNALEIEARLSHMQESLDQTKTGAVGVLRLAANNWMLQRLAKQMLPGLLRDHTGLQMRLSGRLPPNPAHSEPTVSLWFDAMAHSSDIATPFCRVQYAAYRSKASSPDAGNWVQFQDDYAQGPSFSNQLKQHMEPDAQMRLTATDAQVLQSAIQSGLARGFLPTSIGDHDKMLERVPESDIVHRILHFHASKDARRLKRVQIFFDCLAQSVEHAFDGEFIATEDAF